VSGLKVYAVVDYGYRLEYIFSTREKASTWIGKQDYPEDLEIEEIILDDIRRD